MSWAIWACDYAAHGLVVVGVHAPEFEFGKRAENARRQLDLPGALPR